MVARAAFCYVDDLIEGFVRPIPTVDDITGPINLGNPHEIPVKELADRMLRPAGLSSQIVYRPLPADEPIQRCPNIELARGKLMWEPRMPLDDGLARTIAYFAKMLTQSGG
jgi:UDP-glucuronate decarboxylase